MNLKVVSLWFFANGARFSLHCIFWKGLMYIQDLINQFFDISLRIELPGEALIKRFKPVKLAFFRSEKFNEVGINLLCQVSKSAI